MEYRPPTNSNPIRINKLVITPNEILYKQSSYPFNHISNLYFNYVQVQKIGTNHAMQLDFNLKTFPDRIKLYNPGCKKLGPIISYRYGTKPRIEDIEFYSAGIFLLETTFESRRNNYLQDIKEIGYFEYDGCRFYESGIISKNQIEINLNDRSTLVDLPKIDVISHEELDFITFSRPMSNNECQNRGFFGKLIGQKKVFITIDLKYDHDVFFALLGITT